MTLEISCENTNKIQKDLTQIIGFLVFHLFLPLDYKLPEISYFTLSDLPIYVFH